MHILLSMLYALSAIQNYHKTVRNGNNLQRFIEPKYIANSVQTDVLIMDFSKVFYKISHNHLTLKLNYYGRQCKANTWIHNFLSNLIQAVLLEGETSDNYIPVMSGVPQGSVLGPSLFLFYINGIPDGTTSTVRLFADDAIAYLTIKSNRDCTTLQDDLDKLSTCIWGGGGMENTHTPS
jgi:hypothetical protein